MPNLFDPDAENAKIVLLGDSGHGKTGAKASLVAAGYPLRMIDTDRGFRILRSLLTDRRYPYAEFIERQGIDLTEPGRISYIPIDVPMENRSFNIGRAQHSMLAPGDSKAWTQIINLLSEWKDGDVNLGPITDWDNNCILDIDTVSTAAELAKYWVQDINNRLGVLEDDHGRDTGAAQEMIRRLTMKLTSPSVRCNVIATTHISWIDTSRGTAQNPGAVLRSGDTPDPRGFPAIIGQALSPVFGKRWNDMFIVRRTGSTARPERRIYSVPVDNVDAKHSAFVDNSYHLSTGLAEIFAALRYKDPPTDLIKAIRGKDNPSPKPSSDPNNNGPTPKGFGSGGAGFGRRK